MIRKVFSYFVTIFLVTVLFSCKKDKNPSIPKVKDIYIGFQEKVGSKYTAKIWKNGAITSLTDGLLDAIVNDVFVVGNDVYAVGSEGAGSNVKAMLWKNGVAFPLTDGSKFASANAVVVVGSDVYIAG